ncbi:MAG: ATP-binding protein, partial [Gammaproteobacteria bacterium]|nr:ATP-binding protein [Gammaproteobacteria bacterium]
IVDKLLSYSRPSKRQGALPVVNLRRVVGDTLLLVEHELNSKRLKATTDFRETLEVRIDARELQQVLVNLLVNAAQASSEGGRIEIGTRDWDTRGVVLSVRDHGQGIAPEHLKRVFDPFFTTKKSGGTGLGLSVSIGLIQGYGGDIKARSNTGQGATFEVYLLTEPVFADRSDVDLDEFVTIPARSVASQR